MIPRAMPSGGGPVLGFRSSFKRRYADVKVRMAAHATNDERPRGRATLLALMCTGLAAGCLRVMKRFLPGKIRRLW